MWRFPRHSSITFDVGAAGLRVSQAAGGAGTTRIRDAIAIELDAAADEPGALLDRLVRLVDQGAFSGRDVALVLGPPDIQFHALRVPDAALRQGEAQVAEMLRWEVSSQSRAEPDELEVRHWVLPPARRNGENVMAVSMMAQAALDWVEGFSKRGLTLRRIESAPAALTHLAAMAFPPDPDHLWASLDLGRDAATLTVAIGRTPVYVRALPVSMRKWTEQLATALDVPVDVAERVKRENGIAPERRGAAADGVSPGAVLFGLLREELIGLCSELVRCLHYVRQTHDEVTTSRIALAGGGAQTPGLASFIESQLGITVDMLDGHAIRGVRGVRLPSGVTAAEAVACGAALLELEAA
ncbi:MAG: hypothetical protein KDA32_11800 [Phycisphaerales bacterium]|nr:hypothetical protein [Phycisphaerales bacterium]